MRWKPVLGGIATVLGTLVLVVGCVAVLNLGREPEGDCGVEHRYNGASYWPPPTNPLRQPRGLLVVGEAERIACAEVIGHDAVYAVAGVSPDVAVVLDGYLLVRRGATPPRRLLRAAERPIICNRPTTIEGTWQGSLQTTKHEGPETADDGTHVVPYRLEIDATGGDHPAFQDWQRLQVTVVITAETEFPGEVEHAAAYEQVPMLIAAHCKEGRFVADRIKLAPGSSPDDIGSTGTPDESTDRIVEAFVHRVRSSFGKAVWLAVDWDTATILVAAATPVPEELEELDEATVAGLRVDVFPAEVTVDEYEDFIRAVGRTTFAGRDRVCSFSIPKEATFVQVKVDRLSRMSAAAVAALRAHLEELTDVRFVLVEAQQWHWLTHPPDRADSEVCSGA